MYEKVVPLPKKLKEADGVCEFSRLKKCACQGLSPESAELLRADFPGMETASVKGGGFRALIGRQPPKMGPAKAPALAPQAYKLAIAADSIEIQAGGAAGLWHGFQTLAQLRDLCGGRVPTGEIEDEPSVENRCVHVDLKGWQPKFDKLLELFRMLSRHKINHVLLEFEDKLKYRSAPGVGISSAYTMAEMRRLGGLAKAMHINIIPKLQCLGHVDYLLKLPRYKGMREQGHPYQYCPRDERSLELWKNMAGELLEAFHGHKGFHIGADEAMHLADCPKCRNHSQVENYLARVGECVRFLKNRKVEAFIWDDMIRHYLDDTSSPKATEKLLEIARGSTIMYWSYGYGGRNNTFAALPKYLSRKFRVWGASAFSGCGPSFAQDTPPAAERFLNIAAWTKTALENKAVAGLVATGWGRIGSDDPPAESLDACWLVMAYAAESMWSGRERGFDDFVRTASLELFGADLSDYADYIRTMDADKLPPPERAARDGVRNDDHLQVFVAAANMARHVKKRETMHYFLHLYGPRFGGKLADYRMNSLKKNLDEFKRSVEENTARMEKALGRVYDGKTVETVLESRFFEDRSLAARFSSLLKKTKLL